jgi:osmotically-inducible protein OsmY
MLSTAEKTDSEIKTDVLSELEYEPSIKVTDIGVLVKDGAVTLNGYAASYSDKMDAVRAAKSVAGVRAIADDIEIKLPDSMQRSDGDIAATVASHIELSWAGLVEWGYQKGAAANAVRYLSGVKGISNLIIIKPKVTAAGVETAIQSAFERNALVDARKIHVEASGNKVTLRGQVRSHAEGGEAERIAWAAPGVYSVDNELIVEWASFVE